MKSDGELMAERLEKAIERARREREGSIGKTSAPAGSQVPCVDMISSLESAHETYCGDVEKDEVGASESLVVPFQSGESQAVESVNSVPPPTAEIRYYNTRQLQISDEVLNKNKVIAGNIYDPRVEVYRQLRSQVLEILRRNHWRSLAVTSARERAGKTLTCVNLAICISQEINQTVLLVDLDLKKPDVANTMGVEVGKGIMDHLLHGEPIERIMFNPGYPRLVVIPGTPQTHYVSEMLSSPQMKTFLSDILHRYDDRIVIFDLPPLLRNDDAMVFIPNADACLYVVEDGVSRPDDMEHCFQLLRHTKVIGTVLNKLRE
jgi:protein-tyrosine kinase